MANQAQEYQYQQALIYINNEENLNLTEFNDDFIRRIIEQVTVLSATQQDTICRWIRTGCKPAIKEIGCLQRNSTDVLNPGASVLFFCG